MEHRTISARLPINEFTEVLAYCKDSGVTPAALIRNLLYSEVNGLNPSNLAGRNILEYLKKEDCFVWSMDLDDGSRVKIMQVSPSFLEDLHKEIADALESRSLVINKKRKDSVPIPVELVRGRK